MKRQTRNVTLSSLTKLRQRQSRQRKQRNGVMINPNYDCLEMKWSALSWSNLNDHLEQQSNEDQRPPASKHTPSSCLPLLPSWSLLCSSTLQLTTFLLHPVAMPTLILPIPLHWPSDAHLFASHPPLPFAPTNDIRPLPAESTGTDRRTESKPTNLVNLTIHDADNKVWARLLQGGR